MNRSLHRVIFNARRGLRMAVSDTASSHGGGGASVAASSWVALLVAWPLWSLGQTVQTRVVADSQAPGNQRPTILPTASGIPQVNIQTPSAAGVSRNSYSQFDVGPGGVILNNSPTNTTTQIAGYVQGNPWLATGSARVILNEVANPNPSQLAGYVEVAGQRADVIIANPSGIVVNGGGFLNARSVTLSTGAAQWSGGNLTGLQVLGGQIQINGNGLDTSTADYTNILAQAMQVNAGLWARDLKVMLGANTVDLQDLGHPGATPIPPGGSEAPANGVALDVAALGGMYANKIMLIGTEAGLGVNNGGRLVASAGDLEVSTAGWLSNRQGAAIYASGNASVSTDAGLHNEGLIVAQGALSVTVDPSSALTNNGKLQSGATLTVAAGKIDNQAGGVIAGADTVLKASDTLTNRGLIDASAGYAADPTGGGSGHTLIEAGQFINRGTGAVYGDRVSVAALALTNDDETVAGVNHSATIASRSDLDIGAQTLLNQNNATLLSLGDLRIGGTLSSAGTATGQADTIVNNGAAIQAAGNLSVSTNALSNLNSNFAFQAVANGSVYVESYGVNGLYYTTLDGAILLTPTRLYQHNVPYGDSAVFRYAGDARGEFQANASAPAQQMTDLFAYTQTTYTAVATSSNPGVISSGGDMLLHVAQTLNNQQSRIVAGGALQVDAAAINNIANTTVVNATQTGTHYTWQHQDYNCGDFFHGCDYSYEAYVPGGFTQLVPTTVAINTAQVQPNQSTSAPTPVAGAGVPTGTTLPTSSLYRLNTVAPQSGDPSTTYLVQTDPRFVNASLWLSSSYMLNQLQYQPATTQKLLGDGYYEQQLINQQVLALTGQQFLGDFTSTQQEYMALMNAGVAYGQAYALTPGVALSAGQVALLTAPIVWMVTQTVTLPDGSTQQVLAPQVYVPAQAMALQANGALISGRSVALSASGDVNNNGTLQATGGLAIDATNVHNNALGVMQGQTVQLTASNDITNIGGTVRANDAIVAQAGRDIVVGSTTSDIIGEHAAPAVVPSGGLMGGVAAMVAREGESTATPITGGTVIDHQGAFVQGPGAAPGAGSSPAATTGTGIALSAGRDLTLSAAQVQAAGDVVLQGGESITLDTLQTRQFNTTGDSSNHYNSSNQIDVGSRVQAGGNVTAISQGVFSAKAADVSAQGSVNVQAGDIVLIAGAQSSQSQDVRTRSSSDVATATTTTTRTQTDTTATEAQVTQIKGAGGVTLLAQDTLVSQGAVIDSGTHDKVVGGLNQTLLYEALNSSSTTTQRESHTSLAGTALELDSSKSTDQQFSDQAVVTRLISQTAGVPGGVNGTAGAPTTASPTTTILVGNNTDLHGTDITGDTRFAGVAGTAQNLTLGVALSDSGETHSQSGGALGLWQSASGSGTTTQTAELTHINGNVSIDAGVNTAVVLPKTVTYTGKQPKQSAAPTTTAVTQADVQAQLDALSQQPGLGYLKQLSAPGNATLWNQVQLTAQQWNYSAQGLTPAAAAILTIVVIAMTGPAGASLAGAGATATTTAMVQAGFSALAAEASVALINNGGDIGKTLEQLGSQQSVNNLLTAMATAGALSELDQAMGWNSAQTPTGQSGPGSITSSTSGISTAQTANDFIGNLQKNVVNNLAGAVIGSAINGTPLDESTLKTALTNGMITAGMAYGANAIGHAASGKSSVQLDGFTQSVAHAVLGCAGGVATVENASGCAPSAVGAVVGELSAQYYMGEMADPQASREQNLQSAAKFATMMAAISGALVGGPNDAAAVNLAATAGTNAATNNCLGHPDSCGALFAKGGAALGAAGGIVVSGVLDLATDGVGIPANPAIVSAGAALGASTGYAVGNLLDMSTGSDPTQSSTPSGYGAGGQPDGLGAPTTTPGTAVGGNSTTTYPANAGSGGATSTGGNQLDTVQGGTVVGGYGAGGVPAIDNLMLSKNQTITTMPSSSDPNQAALDFARDAMGGQQPVAVKPIGLPGAWVAEIPDGTSITYRPAGSASDRTAATTATVEINSKAIDMNSKIAKLKFPKND